MTKRHKNLILHKNQVLFQLNKKKKQMLSAYLSLKSVLRPRFAMTTKVVLFALQK